MVSKQRVVSQKKKKGGSVGEEDSRGMCTSKLSAKRQLENRNPLTTVTLASRICSLVLF